MEEVGGGVETRRGKQRRDELGLGKVLFSVVRGGGRSGRRTGSAGAGNSGRVERRGGQGYGAGTLQAL